MQFLALIARLYAVESHAQDNNLSAQERLRYRQQHSVAVLGHIQTLLVAHLHPVMPGSSLGKALHYLSAQSFSLTQTWADFRESKDLTNVGKPVTRTRT